jgi:hypothetical protein
VAKTLAYDTATITFVKSIIVLAPALKWIAAKNQHNLQIERLPRSTTTMGAKAGHHDTRHNDIQHNYTRHDDDIQHNHTQHNDIQKNKKHYTHTLDGVIYADCRLCWLLLY